MTSVHISLPRNGEFVSQFRLIWNQHRKYELEDADWGAGE